jgi:hypothetical protein
MFIGGFFMPLILIALFYILIVFLLRKKELFLIHKMGNTSMNNFQNLYLNNSNHNVESSSNHAKKRFSIITVTSKYSEHLSKSIFSKREIKLVKMVSLIVLMYVIAWTPYAVVTFAAQFGSNIEAFINPYTTSLPALFAKASFVYNPLIYTLSNKEFQRFFIKKFFKK